MQKKEPKEILKRLLISTVRQRATKGRIALLLSGGVDSSVIGKILSSEEKKIDCYFSAVKGFAKPKDLAYAKKAAKELNCNLKVNLVSLKEFEKELPKIIETIGTTNPVSVGVASTFYFASKKIPKGGSVFTGLGADELFAGYAQFKESGDLNKDCRKKFDEMAKTDLEHEKLLAKKFGLKLKVPFTCKRLTKFAFSLESEKKISGTVNKKILREVAVELGLSKEIAFRPKKAAQYGSNFDRAIEKLAKKNGFRTKSAYLNNLNEKKFPIGALISTGKDSLYALYLMEKKGYNAKCLIGLIPENRDSYMFHFPEKKILDLQAKALGKDLIIAKTKGEKEKELKELEGAIKIAKNSFGITGVVSGALFSEYQDERIEKICKRLSLKSFAPLWHKNQQKYLKELVREGFEIIITKIACYGLDESWLGRRIDNRAIDELSKLEKKYGINVAGEGGEYETLVLDAPVFKKKIELGKTAKKMENEFTGNLKIVKAQLKEKA